MPYLSQLAFGSGDVGVDYLFNVPCNATYGGVVNVTLTTQENAPNLPFLLTVSANNVTIQFETDVDGNVRTDDYPTNYNSGIAAAIAANPQAAALLEFPVFIDTVSQEIPFDSPQTMGLSTSPGPTSEGEALYISCGGGTSTPSSYIYGG